MIGERPRGLAKKSGGHFLVLMIALDFAKVPPHCTVTVGKKLAYIILQRRK